MDFIESLILILVYQITSIIRGWLYFNYVYSRTTVKGYLKGCFKFETKNIKSLFNLRFYNEQFILNSFTILVYLSIIGLILISF